MSNIAIFSGVAVPAFARNNELSETAKALMGGAGGNTKRISIKGGVFRLVAGGKEVASIDERHLDVIVVKAAPKVSRVFYAGSYDKDAAAGPPDCWSNDGEKPDSVAKNKQSVTCMACKQNVAGSGQGNSRACRYQQRLAVVLASAPEGDVLQLTLPATSVFGKEEGDKRPLQAFVRYLAVQNPPINPEQIVTRMKFDTKAESPKLFFQPMRWLTEDEYATVKTQADSEDAKLAVVMTVAQTDGVKSAPLQLEGKPLAAPAEEGEEEEAPAPKAKAKAKPTPVEAEEDAEPEVRKTPTKINAVPAAKSNLAGIVADWDDE
jgi:hypothetical protein